MALEPRNCDKCGKGLSEYMSGKWKCLHCGRKYESNQNPIQPPSPPIHKSVAVTEINNYFIPEPQYVIYTEIKERNLTRKIIKFFVVLILLMIIAISVNSCKTSLSETKTEQGPIVPVQTVPARTIPKVKTEPKREAQTQPKTQPAISAPVITVLPKETIPVKVVTVVPDRKKEKEIQDNKELNELLKWAKIYVTNYDTNYEVSDKNARFYIDKIVLKSPDSPQAVEARKLLEIIESKRWWKKGR